jgi:GNAT superfamily N-acetyltransferase
MEIREIKATEHIEEAWSLLSDHRDELATHRNLMVLKPDVEKYRALEDQGKLITIALYDGETIVGYSVTMLTGHLHYSDLSLAYNDVLYVHPQYRKGSWGVKLIKMTEQVAKERGMQLILFHGKEHTLFSNLMPRLGYQVQDIVFSKEL